MEGSSGYRSLMKFRNSARPIRLMETPIKTRWVGKISARFKVEVGITVIHNHSHIKAESILNPQEKQTFGNVK